ncbi:hypothetical protein ES703_59153 [subsurface metagenome]
MSMFFFILAIISAICGTVFSLMITSFLSKRGIKINYIFLRLFMFKYIQQYRTFTVEENGKPGNLFYGFLTSMILALVFAVIGVILRNTVG